MKTKYSWNAPPVTLHDPCASLVSLQPRRKPVRSRAKGGVEGPWGDGSPQVRDVPTQTGGITGAACQHLPWVVGFVHPCAFKQVSRATTLLSLGSHGLEPLSASWRWKLVTWWPCHSGHQVISGHVTVVVCDMAGTRHKNGSGAGAGLSFGGTTGHILVFSILSKSPEIFETFHGTASTWQKGKTRCTFLQPAMALEIAAWSPSPFPAAWAFPQNSFWLMGPSDRSSGLPGHSGDSLWGFPYCLHIRVLLDWHFILVSHACVQGCLRLAAPCKAQRLT